MVVLFTGQGGVGKSTLMKHIALKWAKKEKMTQYDFIFHISLKLVKPEQTIEQLILKQHKLDGKGVEAKEIKFIINQKITSANVSTN